MGRGAPFKGNPEGLGLFSNGRETKMEVCLSNGGVHYPLQAMMKYFYIQSIVCHMNARQITLSQKNKELHVLYGRFW